MSSVWAEEHDSPMVFYTAKLSWSKVVLTTDCLWVGVSALDKWYEGLDKAIEMCIGLIQKYSIPPPPLQWI